MDDLAGRVALVTGGSRGIGRPTPLALAEAGADVAVNSRTRAAEAQQVCDAIAKLGRRTVKVAADVSAAAEVERLVSAVEAALGPVGIVVNNAGVSQPVTLETLSEEIWDATIAANLKSVFLVTQAVLPAMRRQRWGRIINISSTAAQTGGIIGPHYAASKAGIHGLTHAYASWLAREGVTANAIAPALVEKGWGGETDWTLVRKRDADGLSEEEIVARLARKEKMVDPNYYPRLRGAAGIFKVSPEHVENHILVSRVMAGGSERLELKLKPTDFADYLIHNALG